MKPTLDEINTNRAKVGMPPLAPARPLNSREAGDKENRDADERLLQLSILASRDPEAQDQISVRLVDSDEGKLRVVADHRGPAWQVWYYTALDVMDYFGLHGPFLDAEQTPDLYSAYNQAEAVIQARGGNTYHRRFKGPRRRHTVTRPPSPSQESYVPLSYALGGVPYFHAAMAAEEDAYARDAGWRGPRE